MKAVSPWRKIDLERGIGIDEKLIAAPEDFGGIGFGGTNTAAYREFAAFEEREVLRGEIEEDILANDGHIRLQRALAVGMPEQRRGVLVGRLDGGIEIACPIWEGQEPAIEDGVAMRKKAEAFAP